jgi:hypothetical protein
MLPDGVGATAAAALVLAVSSMKLPYSAPMSSERASWSPESSAATLSPAPPLPLRSMRSLGRAVVS